MDKITKHNVIMPEGTYFIGDLCYVMGDDWDEVCDLTTYGESMLSGKFTLSDGRVFAVLGTKYGDGEYHSQKGEAFPVDSGLIGAIKIEDAVVGRDEILGEGFGVIHEFGSPFAICDNDGVLFFGGIIIDTRMDGDEELLSKLSDNETDFSDNEVRRSSAPLACEWDISS